MEIHQLENIKATEKVHGIKRRFSWKVNKPDKTPNTLNRKAERNKIIIIRKERLTSL